MTTGIDLFGTGNYAGESTRTIPDHSAGRGVPRGKVPVAAVACALAGTDSAAGRSRAGRLDRLRRRATPAGVRRAHASGAPWRRKCRGSTRWWRVRVSATPGDCHGAKSSRATSPATRPRFRRGQGAAWTNTIADGGDWAVAVDLAPRMSGRWNKGSEPTRDESLCESRTQPGYATDWFVALRPEVCARTTQSPYLFTPGLAQTVLQSGNISVTQPPHAAICVRGRRSVAHSHSRPPRLSRRTGLHARRGLSSRHDREVRPAPRSAIGRPVSRSRPICRRSRKVTTSG